MHDDNRHLLDRISAIDRHLLERDERYFLTSSLDTLEIWERKIKEAIKSIDEVHPNQPTIKEAINSSRKHYIVPNENAEVDEVGRRRKARFCSNGDPVWHKRLKLSYGYRRKHTNTTKSANTTVFRNFRRLKSYMSRIRGRTKKNVTNLCVQFNNGFNTFNSERS